MKALQHNYTIDLLRILSASWVVLFHLNIDFKFQDNWYSNFCRYGNLGVPVFFTISGYCINIAQQHSKKPLNFITRRFFRVYPAFWFSLGVACLCILIQKLVTGYNSAAVFPNSEKGVIHTITLYTAPLSKTETINWVYWSLSFEVAYYLILFVLLWVEKRMRLFLMLILIALSVIIKVPEYGPLIVLRDFSVFTAGYALYLLLQNNNKQWLFVVLFIASLAAIYYHHQNYPGYLMAVVVAIIIITIDRYRPMKANFLSRLGDVSYSLYLIHVPVGVWVIGLFKPAIFAISPFVNMCEKVAVLILLIFISKLIYRYIELPAIKFGKQISR